MLIKYCITLVCYFGTNIAQQSNDVDRRKTDSREARAHSDFRANSAFRNGENQIENTLAISISCGLNVAFSD